MAFHNKYVPILKALSDETRLKIVEMLSCGELCACDILDSFEITQPTLSYHMKILTDSGIIICRKEGTWMKYRQNDEMMTDFLDFWTQLTNGSEACICIHGKEAGRCD